MRQSSLLVLKSVPLVLLDLLLQDFSGLFGLGKSPVEDLNFLVEVIGDGGLVVERVASGLKSLDFDILVLVGDFLTVQLLDDIQLGQIRVVDHRLVLFRGHGCGWAALLWGGH